MKKLLFLFGLVSVLGFTSCDNDGYSLDKYWVSMATVDNPSGGTAFYLLLDNGDKLWPAASNFPAYTPKDGQRIIANYTILSDGNANYQHDIKLNDVYQVLTKPVITMTAENADSIGNDVLKVVNAWIGSDYLNIEFKFPGNGKAHMVNLVKGATLGETNEEINLEFRQNGYDDTPSYWYSGIVSFNLKSLRVDGATSRKIKVSFNTGDKQETFEETYDWSGKVSEAAVKLNSGNFKEVK